MINLIINPNFRTQINQSIFNSKSIKHTHRIIGKNLLIHPEDTEIVGKILKRLELKYK
tara:strand:+ start:618 stop:791 length:174 start_codon:yes stop_codon:yes gene_type:complete